MGCDIHAVIEYTRTDSGLVDAFTRGGVAIARDYELFSAIAFGDGGITDDLPFPREDYRTISVPKYAIYSLSPPNRLNSSSRKSEASKNSVRKRLQNRGVNGPAKSICRGGIFRIRIVTHRVG
jgi:hypothetical protein